MEQALQRVKRLTTANVVGARALADSLVRALAQAEALFARASIAANAAEAEADYERVARFHPLSPRVPDALMRLAVLESSRSDRAGALRHLDRLLREHGDSPPRARASLLAGRLRMEAGDVARACEHLGAAFAAASATERDVQEQATRLGGRCPVAPATLAANAATPLGVVRGQRDTVLRVTTVPPAARLSRAQRDSIAKAARDSATRATSLRRDSLARATSLRRDSAATAARAQQRREDSLLAVVRQRADSQARARRDSLARAAVATAAPRPATTAPVAPAPMPAAPAPVRAPATPPAPAVTSPPVAAPVVPAVTMPAEAAARFVVQFAAYNTRAGAEALVRTLRARGIPARVEGEAAPFRVRAGRYPSRTEAEIAAQGWRSGGQTAIVVPATPGGTP
ncbi:MAG: SPOR domain-containing protein [Gemmatimonadaceae bacterium]|nr:SPOR domain-containing protein [Gemmatimonadaceae bacterium]